MVLSSYVHFTTVLRKNRLRSLRIAAPALIPELTLTVGFLIIGQESLLIGLGYKVGSGRAEAPDGGSLQCCMEKVSISWQGVYILRARLSPKRGV